VILVDATILIYAHAVPLPQHSKAKSWLDEQLNGVSPVGLPWPSLLAFVRVMSSPKLMQFAEPVAEAWQQVEDWLESSVVGPPANRWAPRNPGFTAPFQRQHKPPCGRCASGGPSD
jgi:predicted nucleic acid-binding protein